MEHQLPEGPGAGQVEDEDKQPQHDAHRRQNGGRLDDAALAAGSLPAQQHREGGRACRDAEQEQVDGDGAIPHQRVEVKRIMPHGASLPSAALRHTDEMGS